MLYKQFITDYNFEETNLQQDIEKQKHLIVSNEMRQITEIENGLNLFVIR